MITCRPNISKALKLPATALAALALLITSTAYSVSADESQLTARKLSQAGVILPLEKIIRSAKAIKPGEVLETELELKKGIYVYEVEILDLKSQVWELKLNAKTGKLIQLERED